MIGVACFSYANIIVQWPADDISHELNIDLDSNYLQHAAMCSRYCPGAAGAVQVEQILLHIMDVLI